MTTDQVRLIQALGVLREVLPRDPQVWEDKWDRDAELRKERWLDALLPPTSKEGGAS